MVKRVLLISLIGLLFLVNIVSAINLDISSEAIQNSVITDLNEPATFKLTLINLGETDTFEIYSLVGVNIEPDAPFILESGGKKELTIKLMPQNSIIESRKGYFTFEYKIKNSKNEVQEEQLTMNIIDLSQSITIIPSPINPNSDKITLDVKNNLNYDFKDIKINPVSAFFEYESTISLKPKETKQIEIELDKSKAISLVAGNYLLNTKIEFQGKKANIESMIKYLEQEGIETEESEEGILIDRIEITKTNVGNVPKKIKIVLEKNLISYLITTFNEVPQTQFSGFTVRYTWEKELIPNQEFKLIVKTNWFLPLIIIALAIILYILIRRYVESDLILTKRVSFVKTKGGEFALKVTLKAKAKAFIERVHVIEKLPHLVKLYEKFGAITPDKVDEKNKRIEWNIDSLNKDEERIFSYIIYSKIGVVGKFELPSAKAVYEKEGKIKEVESNRSFFINQPGAHYDSE
ncbi:MAG: hypothetical protein WC438_05185 [Candidatus Pacearchaeota archaeon]